MENLAEIIKAKQQQKKAPAYPWQDLALRIIKDLKIPNFKRSSVFKLCKDLPPHLIERALNDTKELCHNSSAWKYFFKICATYTEKKEESSETKSRKN